MSLKIRPFRCVHVDAHGRTSGPVEVVLPFDVDVFRNLDVSLLVQLTAFRCEPSLMISEGLPLSCLGCEVATL